MAGSGDHADVAVVIPTHRRDVLVARALASVLRQTLAPAIVVVVDDVGTGDTKRVVDEMARSTDIPIRYVDARTDKGGASRSRNIGVDATCSEWLAFVDDDDEWGPDFIESLMSAVSPDQSDFALAAYSLSRDGEAYWVQTPVPNLGWREAIVETFPAMNGSNFVCRRSAFEAVGGYDTDLLVSEDRDLFVRLRKAGSSYAVQASPLLTQFTDGSDHLSTPNPDYVGMKRYAERYREYMTRAQWRSSLYAYHSIMKHAKIPAPARVGHLVLQAIHVSPKSAWATVAHRFEGGPRAYRD